MFLPSAQDLEKRESKDLRIKYWPIRGEIGMIRYLNLPILNCTEPGNYKKEGKHYGGSWKAAGSVRVCAASISSKGRRDFAGPIHNL